MMDMRTNITKAHLRASTSSPAPCIPKESKLLADGFCPSDNDIVCGRSKQSLNHVGNQKFRETIFMNLDRYDAAITKLDKSLVVTSIVDLLRSKSPHGGFVRKDEASGQWYEIGDQLAREKVGHALRDAIKTRAKRAQRKRAQKKSAMDVKREALLKAQRQLFRESLTAAGEDIDMSLLQTDSMSSEEEAETKQATRPCTKPVMTLAVTGAFYDVDDVEKEVLEPPNVARQITLEDVTRRHSTAPTKHNRKAMGDGGYYDITPTSNRRRVSLENKALAHASAPSKEESTILPKLMTLDMMPEPTPVVGPGFKPIGGGSSFKSNHKSNKSNMQDAVTNTPVTCNRRQVSLDGRKPLVNDQEQQNAIKFSLFDVEVDALDNYVVQRISTSTTS